MISAGDCLQDNGVRLTESGSIAYVSEVITFMMMQTEASEQKKDADGN